MTLPRTTIAIVPGHRHAKPGARSAGKPTVYEWPLTYVLASITARKIRKCDLNMNAVTVDRGGGRGLSGAIHEINTEIKPNAVLSLHFNAVEGPTGDYATTLHYPDTTAARNLAGDISTERWTPAVDRKVTSRTDLAILSETEMTAVLDEPFFLDNRVHVKRAIGQFSRIADGYLEAFSIYHRNR